MIGSVVSATTGAVYGRGARVSRADQFLAAAEELIGLAHDDFEAGHHDMAMENAIARRCGSPERETPHRQSCASASVCPQARGTNSRSRATTGRTGRPCSSATRRNAAGWHPALKRIQVRPWCTACLRTRRSFISPPGQGRCQWLRSGRKVGHGNNLRTMAVIRIMSVRHRYLESEQCLYLSRKCGRCAKLSSRSSRTTRNSAAVS